MSHIPVLLEESLEVFKGLKIKTFFDGTLGAGGFAKALLETHPEISLYLGCDKDQEAIDLAKETLAPWKEKVKFIQGDFSKLDYYLEKEGIINVEGFFLT